MEFVYIQLFFFLYLVFVVALALSCHVLLVFSTLGHNWLVYFCLIPIALYFTLTYYFYSKGLPLITILLQGLL